MKLFSLWLNARRNKETTPFTVIKSTRHDILIWVNTIRLGRWKNHNYEVEIKKTVNYLSELFSWSYRLFNSGKYTCSISILWLLGWLFPRPQYFAVVLFASRGPGRVDFVSLDGVLWALLGEGALEKSNLRYLLLVQCWLVKLNGSLDPNGHYLVRNIGAFTQQTNSDYAQYLSLWRVQFYL